jgi:hypothetical protein
VKTTIGNLFFLLLTLGTLAAPAPTKLPPDRSAVAVRRPDPATWERLRADRDFQYGDDLKPAENGLARLWVRFLRWLAEWLYDPSRKGTRDWLTAALVVGVAVFTIWKLLGMDSAGLFGRRNARTDLAYSLESENIHAISFDEEIRTALDAGQYRLAARLHYLWSLKRLTDAGLIDWKPDKTNHAYVGELQNHALKSDFETLTNEFERIWYGGFPLEAEGFEALRERFEKFRAAMPVAVS